MNQFLENYFKLFALIFTVLTSIIFITYFLLRKKIVIENEKTRLNIASTTFVTVYELLHIAGLIYTALTVVLKIYTVFLTVSLVMVVFAEVLYILTFIKLKQNYLKNKDNKELEAKEELKKASDEKTETYEVVDTPILEQTESDDEESDEEDEKVIVKDENGHYFKLMYSKSFKAKLIQTSDETKNYYQELKNDVLSYQGTVSRMSWSFDSINKGRTNILKFSIKRKNLYVYFALNPEEFTESKYNLVKVESKKYASVPARYVVKNDHNLKYAKELIEMVCKNQGIEKNKEMNDDYYLPYEETSALLEKGLIKQVKQPLFGKKTVEDNSSLDATL